MSANVKQFPRPNKSSSYKPPQSQVTFITISPVYEYSDYKLWLAYGLAITISVITVIAGLIVMYLSSAAYNSSFSTILRLGRGAHLSREIVDGDHDGKEPLPKYLEKATISFAGSAVRNHYANSDGEYELVSVVIPSAGIPDASSFVIRSAISTAMTMPQNNHFFFITVPPLILNSEF